MPDLAGADLSNANFTGVNLSKANLFKAKLREANVSFADLNSAYLIAADLTKVECMGTYFTAADLTRAKLRKAWLIGCAFRNVQTGDQSYGVSLFRTGPTLSGTDFTQAQMAHCVFANTDLSKSKGLETVVHTTPSSIDVATIYLSKGRIPDAFLGGCGMPESFLEFQRTIRSRTDFHSCFISYSTKDQEFAVPLYADLLAKGVGCYFAPEDLKIGDELRPTFDEAIRARDKLLLILSEHSVRSPWVKREVDRALDEENRRQVAGRRDWTVLFPIRLDDSILALDAGWVSDLKRRHIGDFTRWKDHDAYQQAFQRLLKDLKANRR